MRIADQMNEAGFSTPSIVCRARRGKEVFTVSEEADSDLRRRARDPGDVLHGTPRGLRIVDRQQQGVGVLHRAPPRRRRARGRMPLRRPWTDRPRRSHDSS